MNHDKDDVLPAADGLWQDIILALTNVDQRFFNGKNQPCPICGGKDRARFIKLHDLPFHCNHCGDKTGLMFYMEYTGLSFSDAVNDVGDYLNLIPRERIEAAQQERKILTSFPSWYQFDMDRYNQMKSEAEIKLSPWQRINGLGVLDILNQGDKALIPLITPEGNAIDFVMIDADGNHETAGGSKIIPPGFYSSFGGNIGKATYLAVSPLVAAHASIFMGVRVICVWELENIWEVGKQYDQPPIVIVSNVAETQEADALKFKQLVYNAKTRSVNRKVYEVGEIMEMRKND